MNVGDIIKANVKLFPLVDHYGIVTLDNNGNKVICHNTPIGKNVYGGSIVYDSFCNFFKSRTLVSAESTNISINTINNESYTLRYKKFDLLNWNCEHFIYWLKNKQAESPQLKYATVFVVIILFLILLIKLAL